MYQHYRNDGGDLTLQKMGLLNEVQNYSRVQKMHTDLGSQIDKYAREQAGQLSSGTHPMSYDFNNAYQLEGNKFAFGTVTISGEFTAKINVGNDGSYSYEGTTDIQFYDRFTDPYDTLNLFKKDWNPDGTPYNISGSGSQPYSGGNP
jgi:hypothetical protein